jgi:hypothetical protein
MVGVYVLLLVLMMSVVFIIALVLLLGIVFVFVLLVSLFMFVGGLVVF